MEQGVSHGGGEGVIFWSRWGGWEGLREAGCEREGRTEDQDESEGGVALGYPGRSGWGRNKEVGV